MFCKLLFTLSRFNLLLFSADEELCLCFCAIGSNMCSSDVCETATWRLLLTWEGVWVGFQNLPLSRSVSPFLWFTRTLFRGLCVSPCSFRQQPESKGPAGSPELTCGPCGLDTPPCTGLEGTVLLLRRLRSASFETTGFPPSAQALPSGSRCVVGPNAAPSCADTGLSAGSSITARSFSVCSGAHAHATRHP